MLGSEFQALHSAYCFYGWGVRLGRRSYDFWFRGLAFSDDACLGASESGALWIFELLQDSFMEVMSRCIGLGFLITGLVSCVLYQKKLWPFCTHDLEMLFATLLETLMTQMLAQMPQILSSCYYHACHHCHHDVAQP